jgi:DNA-binding response OmpR family regulator
MKSALKILAVDDNPSIRESMPFIFAEPRYQVRTEPDGDRALAELDTKPNSYDVIIVDQKMPQMTGVEFVQGIKRRGITSKIVVLSAHLSAEARVAYVEMDVDAMIEKPFDIQKLRQEINRVAA